MTVPTLREVASVREVDMANAAARDYHAAVLWCPECGREPPSWETRCGSCGHVQRTQGTDHEMRCMTCGEDCVWAVVEYAP